MKNLISFVYCFFSLSFSLFLTHYPLVCRVLSSPSFGDVYTICCLLCAKCGVCLVQRVPSKNYVCLYDIIYRQKRLVKEKFRVKCINRSEKEINIIETHVPKQRTMSVAKEKKYTTRQESSVHCAVSVCFFTTRSKDDDKDNPFFSCTFF